MSFIRLNKSSILQFISDIHLEYSIYRAIRPVGTHLALCGDIGDPFKNEYTSLIKSVSNSFKEVFLISGNHEYFQDKYTMNDVDNKISDIVSKYNNVKYLNKSTTTLDEYNIVGCTLWTQRNMMSRDTYKINVGGPHGPHGNIRKLTVNDINNLHNSHKHFIINNSKKPNTIVLTHHLPSYRLVVDDYKTEVFEKYHQLYSSNLDDIIKPPIKFWLCGHSHSINNCIINGVYCAINSAN